MLKGVDPIIGPELLGVLRAMGHGDEIALVDANFPATAVARRLVRADGVDAVRLADSILALLPLDEFEPCAAFTMAVIGAPEEDPPVVQAFRGVLSESGYDGPVEPLERYAFYARAQAAYAIVATGERRLYGDLILKKGIIRPPSSAETG